MKILRPFALIGWGLVICFCLASCGSSKKRGCPANAANMGAERLMSGEKPPKKTSKFKIKGMQ